MRLFFDLLAAGICILWVVMIGLLLFDAIENVLFSKTRRHQPRRDQF